jgi:hypothetical protein
VLLDRYAILLPLRTIVVLGLGKSPVPSITVAPSRIITPSSACVGVWLYVATRELAKAKVTAGETKSDVTATTAIPTDTTDNRFILAFLIT